MTITASHPLSWPAGWPRTDPEEQLYALGAYHDSQGWNTVLKRLQRELRLLGADQAVLSTNQPIRRDGLPYQARRNIEDPGVALYFQHAGKSLAMAQDRYQKLTDNIRRGIIANSNNCPCNSRSNMLLCSNILE